MGCNQSKASPNAEYFTEDPDLIETGVVQKKKMQNPQEVQDIDDNNNNNNNIVTKNNIDTSNNNSNDNDTTNIAKTSKIAETGTEKLKNMLIKKINDEDNTNININDIKLNNKKKESIESNSATTTRNDVDDNALSPSPSPTMESMPQLPGNRNQIDEHLLSKKIWNAFTDGTMQKIKEQDAQTCTIMHETTGQFLNLYSNHLERLHELKHIWECKIDNNSNSGNNNNNKLSLNASISNNVSSIVALITKHQDAKNHLNINILNPLIENSDTYLQTIDLLVEKHQQLVDQLAIYNDECTTIEMEYHEACDRVDAAIERRNKYANEENQDGRLKLKKNVDAALEFMIQKENDYKEALAKYHQHQEDMQNEISQLLYEFQQLKVNRTNYCQQVFQKLGVEMQHSSKLLLEFSQILLTCSTNISTSIEINTVVNRYESEGTFEKNLREFKSGESQSTSNQRKQYHQANNAYKHDGGKSGETDFLNTMKSVNARTNSGGGSGDKISLKKLEANHRNLDAQSKWKLKHGGGGVMDSTNPFAAINANASKKTKGDNSPNNVKKSPPSFKKPSFKKPTFKKPSFKKPSSSSTQLNNKKVVAASVGKNNIQGDVVVVEDDNSSNSSSSSNNNNGSDDDDNDDEGRAIETNNVNPLRGGNGDST